MVDKDIEHGIHPDTDKLKRFGQGLLSPAEAAMLEEHFAAGVEHASAQAVAVSWMHETDLGRADVCDVRAADVPKGGGAGEAEKGGDDALGASAAAAAFGSGSVAGRGDRACRAGALPRTWSPQHSLIESAPKYTESCEIPTLCGP
jgi:hypothetical protein